MTNSSRKRIVQTALNFSGRLVKPLSYFGYMHLTMFAKPVCDRAIYKLIRKNKFRSFVEIGMETGTRCLNMIQVAKKYGVSDNVRYTGVDQFDARGPESINLPLIEMHKKLKTTDAKAQLVPGDVPAAIARIANSHVRTDLIVVSSVVEAEDLDACWFFVPRMLHSGSLVLIQDSDRQEFRTMNRLEVERVAEKRTPSRVAA